MRLLLGIILVIFATVLGAFGALLFKIGSRDFSLNLKRLLCSWHLILGCFLYLVSTVPFVLALKFGDLSVLYPFVATSYIWVTFLSLHYLKEKMNNFKWIGIAAIIIGVTLIGLGSA